MSRSLVNSIVTSRLARWDRTLAVELMDLIADHLARDGAVDNSFNPHLPSNQGGIYNGCVEFHLADDVLVLYSPAHPTNRIRMRRICTHRELATGQFGQEWPQ